MSSKGAITITQDELTKMKMRANLIPSGNCTAIQAITNRIVPTINIKRVRSALINGQITSKTLKRGRRKRDIESFRRRSLKDEELIKRRRSSSTKSRNKNLLKPTQSSSNKQNKSADSIANFCSQILSKEEKSKQKLKTTSKMLIKRGSSFITNKLW